MSGLNDVIFSVERYYNIISYLGKGNFSFSFRVNNKKELGKDVVVKVINLRDKKNKDVFVSFPLSLFYFHSVCKGRRFGWNFTFTD